MDAKKTAVAMLGGCETGQAILTAERLLSPVDSPFYRESVRSAAEMVVACATCEGCPERIEDPEAFPCPVQANEDNELILRAVLQVDENR